jgi:hypothetical protein
MTTTATPDVTFTKVDAIPAQIRATGEGREPIKWEDKLSPVKSSPGEGFLAWQYVKKSAATSRVAAIRNRLFAATPADNWTLAVRPVPNSDPVLYGVYVQYNGTFTPDEQKQNAKVRQERSDKIKASRLAAQKANGAIGAEEPVQTPAQRVAAAKAAQK